MEQQIAYLISQLTLEEKVSMIHGATLFRTGSVDRLGIPALCMSDGPMGVRAEFADAEWRNIGNTDDYVTYLPCNSAIASTWNRELAYEAGSVLGEEARGRGKDVILAPGINIKRSPLCGRNFEYMSEDPFLVEELVVPMVKGIQKHDVAACVKHFAANSQETARMKVDTVVDERTLNEIYFPGFRAAIEKGGIFSLMGAYNRLNGEYCCTGEYILNAILRDAWNFDGMVVSDWGGVHDTISAARSGLDIEMHVTYDFDNHFLANPLIQKIKAGEIPEEWIDKKVRNILRLMLRLKMIGPGKEFRSSGAYNTAEHRTAAQKVAEESVVLLKNENSLLPLTDIAGKKVAVIGANAVAVHSNGGGSAEIRALYEITPLMGIKKLLGGNTKVSYAPGYYVPDNGGRSEISWQAESTKQQPGWVPKLDIPEDVRIARLEEAVSLAQESDVVIFVGGLDHNYDVEGLDRMDMKLPYGQDQVLEKILDVNPYTVVVIHAGAPVEMPWLDGAKAVLWSYYAGMEGGTALAEIIFGKINPSGKLAETFIRSIEQCPAKQGVNFGRSDRVEYTEGVMVGYRCYNTEQTDVNFCFGHGLSYTKFAYENICVNMLGDNKIAVSVDITNVGSVPGLETVQLYISPKDEASVMRPYHQLRGFEKIALKPGEKKKVTFTLRERDFAVFDTQLNRFSPISGNYEVQVGSSSRDIRLTASICVSYE